MSGQRPADSRDMIAVHVMFRREFTALPGLVRGVPAGDRARTRTVAGHVGLMVDLLHTHHRSEDTHCWPLLAARGPGETAAVTGLMESQHGVVDRALRDAEELAATWRASASGPDRDALAGTLDGLLGPLAEHLVEEERSVLPLIDRYLTAAEWADVGNQGLATIPPARVPVLFGMLLRDASDEHRALLRDAVPTPVFAVMSRIGPPAYRRYRRKVFAGAS